MEGLAVAAGFTGVLAFAIQSSKVIWETLSRFKEAPADVERLIIVVSNLRFLLEQLENLWKNNDRDGGTLSKDLEVVISTCAFDIDRFQKQISRFQASPDQKTWKRTWRCLKSVLEKEKLHSMRMVILQHHSALEGHLALANYKSNIDQRNQLTRLLTDTTTSSQEDSSEFHSFIQNFQTATTQNVACFESTSKQADCHQANQKVSNQASENVRKDILAVKKDIETGNVEMQKKLESTSQSLDSLGKMVQRLSIGFSEGQIKTLTSIITSLQSQNPTRDLKYSCFISQSEDCDAQDAEDSGRRDDMTEAGSRLRLSLCRLARIAKDARTFATSQETRSVLEALDMIFDLMVDRTSIADSPSLQRKRAVHCDSVNNEAEHGQEKKRIKGLLNTSQSIILNPKAPGPNRNRSGYRVKRLTRAEVFKRPSETLSILSTSQNVTNAHYHQNAEAESSCHHTLQKYAGKATFWTKNTAFPYKISATVLQNLTCNGYYSLKPTLSFHAMIPFESEVFVTVKTGNLLRLKCLLQQRKACLTDCDPDGRSLLSYASYHRHPDICEYLIENGADLNSLEPIFNDVYWLIVPLAHLYYKGLPGLNRSSRSQACYRLMLLAGTDPLIKDQRYMTTSVLSDVIRSGTSQELQMMLHHAGEAIDPEELVDINDCTMLLCLCSAYSGFDDQVESLRLLLKFGVNVNATDNYGNTAIHLFLKELNEKNENGHAIRKNFLTLLLQSIMNTGADLHVKNHFGIEASQVAYRHLSYDDKGHNYLPQRTRLWNEVLTESGLDISEFRSRCSGCRCQNGDIFQIEVFCDSFEKGAYLDFFTLCPTDAGDFSVGSSCSPKRTADSTRGVFDHSNEEHNDLDAEAEDHHLSSNLDKITTTTGTSNQEPDKSFTPDTQAKTFWNVI